MNIAVRVPNWIGDCIMCLPAIDAIKKSIPDSKISIICKSFLSDIFTGMDGVDDVVPIPDSMGPAALWQTSRVLKKYSFDRGCLFTNSFGSALLFKLAGIPSICGYNRDGRRFLLSLKIPYIKNDRHHAFYYLDMVSQCMDQPFENDVGVCMKPSEAEKRAVAERLSELGIGTGKTIIGMAPTAAYGSAKEWPAGKYRQLIGEILSSFEDVRIVLLGSRKEKQGLERIAGETGKRITVLAGDLTLREAIVAVSFCRVFVSNDSGLMHVAAALGIPQVAIFGPTNPQKTSPLNTKSVVLFEPPACWPCLYRECPEKSHLCMENISVDRVFKEVNGFLNEK